ncbi:MAG: SRPBCC family protein [Pseudomonadota bacterium]|nr:SRPBCC family protein [Pseudomonadota bacterium]
MTFRGVQLAASFTLLATTASLTLLPIAAHGSKAEPTVNVERVNGLITVEASVSAPVDARLAWQVLTDYEHLADFIPGMHKSGVVSTGSEPIRVEQLGEGGFLFYHFPIEIVLQMDETPFESIRFHAVGGNIEQMEGVWRLEGSAPVHVRYRARMKPQFWVPPLIGPAVIRRDVRLQLDGLVREMERRAAHSSSLRSLP